jgi:2-polyprenyl-3-methyl-5-hydroxy-6-metoxy-1,4-benzoquinol methylase
MTRLDRYLQRYRIRRAGRFIAKSARVLDIGCADGALFAVLSHLSGGVGIDPDLTAIVRLPNAQLYPGYFPADLPESEPFDAITMLAVLEHVPEDQQITLAANCFRFLRERGRVIITVPSPLVDRILVVLRSVGLVHAETLHQHYGFDVRRTPQIFGSQGFSLLHSSRFQLGLNNLFVFEKAPAER